MQRALLFGTFDHLHPGHRFVLQQAQTHGAVTVVVALDETVRRIKGYFPRQPLADRMKAIALAFPAVQVIAGDAEDFLAPLRTVQPDLIVLGYDQHLPPGVQESDLPCPVVRLPAHHPYRFKSSLLRPRAQPDSRSS